VPHNRPPSQGFGCANSRRGTLPRHRECAGWEEATEAKTHSEGISGLAVAGADRAGRKPQPASASSPSLRTLGLHCCTLLRINPSCAGRPTMGILARTKGQPARTRTGRHCRRHKAMPDSDQIGSNATLLKPPELGEGKGGPPCGPPADNPNCNSNWSPGKGGCMQKTYASAGTPRRS
jgi:hypothetical protein